MTKKEQFRNSLLSAARANLHYVKHILNALGLLNKIALHYADMPFTIEELIETIQETISR